MAIKGGHLLIVHPEKSAEPEPEVNRTEELLSLTRKEIMDLYGYLDPEDREKAKACPNKAALVEFLLDIEKDYE